MIPLVVDASVAIKWFIPDEPGHEASLTILDDIKNDPKPFAVPELFFNEMTAVLCKLFSTAAEICSYLDILQNLGWQRLGNGRKCLHLATELAKRHHLTGYDAIYAANAKLANGVWLTADAKAHKAIASLKISRLIV